jgi:hypothetical protein
MWMLSGKWRSLLAGFVDRVKIFSTASLLIAGLAYSAEASTYTYTFTDTPFTTYAGNYNSSQETQITGSFTTLSITGTIVPSVYDFTDGFNDFNQNNSFLEDFVIIVDPVGTITSFTADIRKNEPSGGQLALSSGDCTTCASDFNDLSFIFATSTQTFGYSDPCDSAGGCAENLDLQSNIGVWRPDSERCSGAGFDLTCGGWATWGS